MLAFSDILAFLLHLLGDDPARAEFERDPTGTLERAGLEGVTAQDIRDARLQLADSGAVRVTDDDGPAYHGDDPVREIGYTARHYAADENGATAVDHGDTLVTIDDRDTLFFQSISDDDVTVTDNSVSIADSFDVDNSDDDVVAIQDNDTVNAVDSFDGAFTEDNDVTAVQDNDVAVAVDTGGPGSGEPADVAEPEPSGDDPDPDGTASAVEDDSVDVDDDAGIADAVPAG